MQLHPNLTGKVLIPSGTVLLETAAKISKSLLFEAIQNWIQTSFEQTDTWTVEPNIGKIRKWPHPQNEG